MSSKKLGYFSDEFVRRGQFIETRDLPQVNFSYKPLNVYQTAALVTQVLDTQTIEDSTEQNLRMATLHLTDWDMLKPNPKFGATETPKTETAREDTAEDSDKAVEPEFNIVDFSNVQELKKVSPIIMNFILNTIRGDDSNPLMDKVSLEAQVKNL